MRTDLVYQKRAGEMARGRRMALPPVWSRPDLEDPFSARALNRLPDKLPNAGRAPVAGVCCVRHFSKKCTIVTSFLWVVSAQKQKTILLYTNFYKVKRRHVIPTSAFL